MVVKVQSVDNLVIRVTTTSSSSMFDYWDFDAYDDDDEVLLRRPKIVRERINHFERWDRQDFFIRFRLSPRTVENILEEVEDAIAHPTNRNDALSAEDQLLLTLRFFATGSFLSVVGDFTGVCKSTASQTVARVTTAIAALRPRIIYMPETAEDVSVCRQKFYNIARFPGCIGAIDCSHVKIQSPGGDNGEIYRNRKQFFSINVQTVADADFKIRNIVARWPGSSHDAHIFRNSRLYQLLEAGHYGDSVLLGDGGYPIKNYLITPLRRTENEAENLFNESQIRTRNPVEKSYGIWKRRFPGLALGLRLKLETIQSLIVATAILHNIACDENERVPPVNEEEAAAIQLVNNVNNNAALMQAPNARGINNVTRHNLIYNYFGRL